LDDKKRKLDKINQGELSEKNFMNYKKIFVFKIRTRRATKQLDKILLRQNIKKTEMKIMIIMF
jgi:hypothetical protein